MKVKFSLNLKLLILITLLVVSPMMYLAYNTISLQKVEAVNNAYERQASEVKLLGEKFNNLVKNSLNTLRTIGSASDISSYEQYRIYIESVLKSQGQDLNKIYIIEVPLNVEQSDQVKSLYSSNYESQEYDQVLSGVTKELDEIIKKGYSVSSLGGNQVGVILADLNYNPESQKILVLVGLANLSFLSKQGGFLQIASMEGENLFSTIPTLKNVNEDPLFSKAKASGVNLTTLEFEEDGKKMIGSGFVVNNFMILTKSNLFQVLSPVYELIQQIVLICLLALSLGIALIVAFAKKISSPIERLVQATEQIGRGNFKIKIHNKSNDEVGVLATSFEKMSNKVETLLKDQEQKLRLENEFNMAAKIQQKALPTPQFDHQKFSLVSQNIQASECGGDWWGYFVEGNKLVLMIGDATGHGLTSAMVTVAAKTAQTFISSKMKLKEVTEPNQMLQDMNNAIYDYSKGEVLMTFFVAVVDFDAKNITFANAGHNPPWLLRSGGKVESLAMKSIRLGETPEYELLPNKTIAFDDDDSLFLYTDGLTESKSLKGVEFGKNNVRKLIQEEIKKGIKPTYKKLSDQFSLFLKGKKAPDDDATFVIVNFKKEAS